MFSKLGQKSVSLTSAFRQRSMLAGVTTRGHGNMTIECADHLKALGIVNKNIVFNPR